MKESLMALIKRRTRSLQQAQGESIVNCGDPFHGRRLTPEERIAAMEPKGIRHWVEA